MRIVAGKYRGLPLLAVPGKGTRPTTDKIKESEFNVLGQFLDGGKVLDYYAGSGALGLEALSRGAEEVYAFEKSRLAIDTIKKNVQKAKVEEVFHLFQGDNQRNLKRLKAKNKDLKFQWVFLDPPYALQKIESDLQFFMEENLLANGAVIVAEISRDDHLPDVMGPLNKFQEKEYASTRLNFYHLL